MKNQKPDELYPSEAEALRLFEEGISLSELSLEQVVMCVYKKPCIRIAPKNLNDTRYGHGSVLVGEDSITIVLNPEDDSLWVNLGSRKIRFIGPQRHFDYHLPGSRFYTPNTVTCVNDRIELTIFRTVKMFWKGNIIPVGMAVDSEPPFSGEEGNMLPPFHPRGPEVTWLTSLRNSKAIARFMSEV